MEKLSLEEIKKKTMELIGTEDPNDVEYITQELIENDYEEDSDENLLEETNEKGEITRAIYGHNMSYCWKNGEQAYCYQRGSDGPCGHSNMFRYFSTTDHVSTSRKCSHSGSTPHRHITKFVPR